jgi:hypothetical protein
MRYSIATMTQPDSGLVPLTQDGLELELDEMESLNLKTLLEANGIPVVMSGASQMPNLPYELLVPVEQLERALAVIREAQAAGPAAAEEAASLPPEPAFVRTVTVPRRSVRSGMARRVLSAWMVAGCGNPNEFLHPALMRASAGRVASSSGSERADFAP